MRLPAPTLTAALALLSSPAAACTLCHSDNGTVLRAAVFGANFWPDLADVLVAFPALALAVALVRRITP
jgi:hypothetical protein